MIRRGLLALAGALAVTLTASACSGLPFGARAATTVQATPTNPAATTPPSGRPALARFYSQRLVWHTCSDFECTRLTVPVDYAKPDGATIQLAVLKAPASSPARRVGALVVNPGGPGASGVDYAAAADTIVTKPVHRVYDVVGFDPRGVDRSSPIRCLDNRQLDAYLGGDPTPDTPAEQQQFVATQRDFAAHCAANGGPLLAHVSTLDVARDMDVLRAALGETRLNYLGKSYGTFIGETYAELFPKKVGRFVLDGVIAPDLTSAQVNEGQAIGFETATRAYVADCVRQGSCPLGASVDEGMQRLRDFLASLDAHPLPVKGNGGVTRLTEGWGSLGLGEAMYSQGLWGELTDALAAAFAGDGNPLMSLADQYAYRRRDGSYDGNMMQVIYAVNCLDRADSKDPAHYEKQAQQVTAEAPTWGAFLAWSSVPCGFWPVPANNAPKRITAAGSGPIVVVGTTRDPATPYSWAVDAAGELQNGHLITYNGDGHTAYTRSNQCVDGAVDAYLLHGTVPRDGLTC